MIRIAFILCVCSLIAEPCDGSPQGELLQDKIKSDNLRVAESQLERFLTKEAEFPTRYAVESSIEMNAITNKSVYSVVAMQWIAIDESKERWLAENSGRIVRASGVEDFKCQGYWNGKKLYVKQESTDSGQTEWFEAPSLNDSKLNFKFVHPRYSWICLPSTTMDSFQLTSLELLGGKDCVGVSRRGKLSGSVWANKQGVGLNRVSGVFFDSEGVLSQVEFLPSIKGNFDAKEVNRIANELKFRFVSDLSWKQLDKRVRVLERVSTQNSSAGKDCEIIVRSKWLLGDKVKEQFWADPRTDDALSLRDLQFEK